MSEIVKCEVCGGIFNFRYVNSHKRLAHRKKTIQALRSAGGAAAIDEILSIYLRLSNEEQRDLLNRLTVLSEAGP